MVKFKAKFLNKCKLKIELIDDAEGTPGSSRQYTRFKEHISEFEQAWNNTCEYNIELAIKTLSKVLLDESFKIINFENDDNAKTILFFVESIEK